MRTEEYRSIQREFLQWELGRGSTSTSAAVYASNLGRLFFRGMADPNDLAGLVETLGRIEGLHDRTKARFLWRRFAEFRTAKGYPVLSVNLDAIIPPRVAGRKKGGDNADADGRWLEPPEIRTSVELLFKRLTVKGVDRAHSITADLAASTRWGSIVLIDTGTVRYFARAGSLGLRIPFLATKDASLLLDLLDATWGDFGRKNNPTVETFVSRFSGDAKYIPSALWLFPSSLSPEAGYLTPRKLLRFISSVPVETNPFSIGSASNREVANTAKDKPCADCGQKFPPHAMDFDHVRGTKIDNIAALVNAGIPSSVLLEEIKKCDVVCANCHRIRTHRRHREPEPELTGFEDGDGEEENEIETIDVSNEPRIPLSDILGSPEKPPVNPFAPKIVETKPTIRLADLLPPDRE